MSSQGNKTLNGFSAGCHIFLYFNQYEKESSAKLLCPVQMVFV